MKKCSKFLAGVLTVVMLIGLLPTAAFATNVSTDPPDSGAQTSITVTVCDAQDSTKKLSGCGIQLERVTAGRYESAGIQYTGTDGSTTWGSLEPGWYRITQVRVADGYKINSAPIVRWFGSDDNHHTVSIENYAQRSLTIKRMANGTTPVEGAKFEVRDTNDTLVASGTTDSTGILYIPTIAPGNYTVRETFTPTGIDPVSVAQNPQNLTVSQSGESGDYSLLFNSSEQPALFIHYLEKETHKGIAGAIFSLWKGEELVESDIRTDNSGVAIVANLEAGTYKLRQTFMPDGYVNKLQDAEFTVKTGNDTNVIKTFYGDRPGTLTILVSDSQTGTPLAGAEVKLYTQGNKLVQGPLTTSGEGLVTFSGLESINYSVVVSKAPSGYTMDTSVMAVEMAANTDTQRVFTATICASLCVYLQNEDGAPLSNCEFALYHQNGTKVGTYKTGASGSVIIPNLKDGYYVVEQITCPDGYVMTNATQTVKVSAGSMSEVTFINREKPFVVAYGYVSGTSTAVPGAAYELWDTDNNLLQTITADNAGKVVFEDLTPGTYVVRCTNVPDGYTLVSSAQTVTVTAKKAGIANFLFDKHSSIIVKALDSKTGLPLAGAMFQIRSEDGTVIEQITTAADGCAVTQALTPGKYVIQQYYAPDGYVCDNYFQTITVTNNKTAMATFTQSQKSVITIYATDAQARPLVGVKFAVYDGVTGKEVASLVSDEAGVATTSPMTPGAYTVKELASPDGYLLTTSYQTPVALQANQATYVRFPHVKQDTVLIETVDMTTRNTIGPAQYSVTNLNGDLIGTYTSSVNGIVEVGSLTPGDYIVKQITAPEGYRICTESQTIKVVSGRNLNLRFANYALSGIAIEAREQSTHKALANVTFEVYDSSNKQVFHGTTDATGYLTTEELPSGKYTVKQLSTPDGYTAVETTKLVNVTYNELTTVVFEQKAHSGLVIELVDAENKDALEGGRFKVQDINGNIVQTVVTDEGGTAIVSGLAAGKYMVTQVEAPDGYILEGNYQWAEMKTGVATTYVKFTNNRISGLTIRALDRNTNAPLANATFDIYKENDKLVQTVTTDTSGITTVTTLAAGTYLVKEVKAPEGYQVDTASQKVTITKNANSTLTFNHVANADVTLKAVASKDGSVLKGVTFKVTKANGDYVGEYTTSASGLVQIPALNPGNYVVSVVSVPDGYILDSTARTITVKTNVQVVETFEIAQVAGLTIRVTEEQTGIGVKGVELKITTLNGTLVGNYVTNASGYVNADLQPGQYVVYQTRVPDGYTIDSHPYNVTVRSDIQTNLEMEIAKESHIRIQVIDSNTSVGVYNVEIEITDSVNNYIGRYRTDNEGYIYLDEVLSSGRYKLRMLSVPDGYVLDSVVKTVSVELNGTTSVRWPISGQQGQLTITTLSAADNTLTGTYKGSRLSGAVYTITNMSGTVVGTIYGDSYGEAHSGALAVGSYYIQQVQAPAGYMVNSQRVTVNISSKNDNVKITVYNKSGNFATSIEAHGPRTVNAGNLAKFYWTNIYNKSSVAVSNFFWHVKVPTDGARAATFYTGTYTGVASTYYVEYKTNYSDYRTLASGLNSKSQYSYDLSSIALSLSSGEYVTDVRVVFPTAAAGMHESMAPSLYVSVLPNVVNGYQLINRAEAGCQGSSSTSGSVYGSGSYSVNTGINSINNGWTSSSSQSTTVVTNYQYPIPSTLPKTGY